MVTFKGRGEGAAQRSSRPSVRRRTEETREGPEHHLLEVQRRIGNSSFQRTLFPPGGRAPIQRQDAAAGGTTTTAADDVRRVFQQGMRLYTHGRYRDAIIRFERVRQMSDVPDEVARACLFNIGQSNLRLRRYATAIAYFEEYLTMPGADREGALALLREAKANAGVAIAEEDTGEDVGQAVPAEELRERFYEAAGFYEQGRFRQAIVHFERVRHLPSDRDDVRRDCIFNIGQSYLRLGEFDPAIVYFEQYLEMAGADRDVAEPRLREARRGAGLEEEPAGAGSGVTTTSEAPIPPARVRELFYEAADLYSRGRYRRAIIRFERLRHIPGIAMDVHRDCLFNIGQSNLRLRRFATAIRYFEEYLTMPGADVGRAESLLVEAREGAGAGE